MRWYPTGFDFGNGDTDLVILRGKERLTRRMPTAFIECKPNDVRVLQGLIQQAKVEEDEEKQPYLIQYANDPFCYAFGEYALTQGVEVWTGRGDENRYASSYALMAVIVAAASLLPKEKEFGLYLVSGLPVDSYLKNQTLRARIKEKLDGVHRFSLDGGTTWKTVAIQVGTVVMEGAGALIEYAGELQPNTESAVVDIGQQTTDLYAQRGNFPMLEFCRNKHIGVETATLLLCNAFEQKYAPRTLSALEAREILRTYASNKNPKQRKYPQITVYGEAVPATVLDDFATRVVRKVGEDIASFVISSWRQAGGAARFSPVLLIGGGYYCFSAMVQERIKHLRSPDDPTFANALGYARLAAKLMKNQPMLSLKGLAAAGEEISPDASKEDESEISIETQAGSTEQVVGS